MKITHWLARVTFGAKSRLLPRERERDVQRFRLSAGTKLSSLRFVVARVFQCPQADAQEMTPRAPGPLKSTIKFSTCRQAFASSNPITYTLSPKT